MLIEKYELNGFMATEEQASIVNRAKTGESFKVMSLAGTGKTTTAELIAAYHKVPTTYICFSKIIADKAKNRMPGVDARTINSIAYRKVLDYKKDSGRVVPNLYVTDVASSLEISKGRAVIVRTALINFCISSDREILGHHLKDLKNPEQSYSPDMEQEIIFLAKKYWDLAWRKDSKVLISHDFYVKKFHIDNLKINTQLIIIDESQDLNPVNDGIIKNQKDAQVVWIGDENQQIFKWRGAVNQMSLLDLPEERLTASFRFGPELAKVANIALNALDSKYLLEGEGGNTQVIIDQTPKNLTGKTFLGRTNIYLVIEALGAAKKNKKIFLPSYKDAKAAIWSGYFLKQGMPEKVYYAPFKGIRSWEELYEKSDDEPEIAQIVKFIENFDYKIKKTLDLIENMNCELPDEADVRFYTIHKSKGEEFKEVVLSPEFSEVEYVSELGHKNKDELNLVYVAITRAKEKLFIESALIDNLKSVAKK